MIDKLSTRNMLGKVIVSEEGRRFGVVGDLNIITESGELMSLVIADPTKQATALSLQEDEKGRKIVPFSAVKSIGDFIIVSEKDII